MEFLGMLFITVFLLVFVIVALVVLITALCGAGLISLIPDSRRPLIRPIAATVLVVVSLVLLISII